MPSATLGLFLALPLSGQAHPGAAVEESAATVCSNGTISEIVVRNHDIFEPDSVDLKVLELGLRAANFAHIRTREEFIRGELLFEVGDCVDPVILSDSQRILEGYRFLAYARITTEARGDGTRVTVETRDEWTTRVDVGATYDEGIQLEKLSVTEENFLGQGVSASFSFRERLEERSHSFGLSTPRLFGRTNASVSFGNSRAGSFFNQHFSYPFLGESGVYSGFQGYGRSTGYFRLATDGAESFSDVLIPLRSESFTLGGARQFGDPGQRTVLGFTVSWENYQFPGDPEVALEGDFDNPVTGTLLLPEAVARQMRAVGSTRIALHLGTRRYRYEPRRGLDAIRDEQTVGLGYLAGISVGRGLGAGAPSGVEEQNDWFGRAHASFGREVGPALFHGGTTWEARYDGAGFKDVLGELDLVTYLRGSWLPLQTLFFRASFAGGWNTRIPFQLTLGGREGVRALGEDRFPGGRQLLFTAEDRITIPWIPFGAADLGLTFFADYGRVWAGDAPYGIDSDWYGAAGFGARFGFPSGTRSIYRADIIFPLDPLDVEPVFRITFEFNKFSRGFFTGDLSRSRRFRTGPEHF